MVKSGMPDFNQYTKQFQIVVTFEPLTLES